MKKEFAFQCEDKYMYIYVTLAFDSNVISVI